MKTFSIFCLCILISLPSLTHADMALRDGTIITSLIRVIANPEIFEGKKIQVVGFFVNEFEHHALYLSRDDAKYGIYENALWVGEKSANPSNYNKKINRHFCKITGIYSSKKKGHLGLWPGELTEISFLDEQVEKK